MDTKLKDKVILVTGASSGLGRATCVELARQGADVILLARNEMALDETIRMMQAQSGTLKIVCDLKDFTRLQEAVNEMYAWHGHVDGLVYSAGIAARMRLRDTTPELAESIMKINCLAFIELVRLLMKQKKKIDLLQATAISSLAALGQDKFLVAYSASKGALEAAARTMAVELMGRNTRINLIRLAFAATPMGILPTNEDSIWDNAGTLAKNGYQPLGVIPPEEVAKMAAFLVGPDSLYSTGCVFTINAGAIN